MNEIFTFAKSYIKICTASAQLLFCHDSSAKLLSQTGLFRNSKHVDMLITEPLLLTNAA